MDIDLRAFKKNISVAAAVSGGIDSMVMLHKLNAVRDEIGFRLCVVNVDHNMRPRSAEDSKFVKEYAAGLGLEFFGFSVAVKEFALENKLSDETAARILRYKAFDETAADFVALAHHLSDQAESVLMHIIRGSGMNGACGMKPVNGKYIRPLLSTSKEEIKKYRSEHGIPYTEDETNADNIYTRNFIRNDVLPLLKQVNPAAEKNIAKFASRLREDEDYLKSLAAGGVRAAGREFFIPAENFTGGLWKRQVFSALGGLGADRDIEERHLELIRELAIYGKTGSSLDMPFGVKAVKDYGAVAFTREIGKERGAASLPFKTGCSALNGKLISVSEGPGRFKFDLDKIPEGAVFRCRREGDVFTKHNGGTKAFKDYLIDKKVPRRVRDGLVVLAFGNEILFAEGVETSGKIWTDGNSRRVYNICVYKTDPEEC